MKNFTESIFFPEKIKKIKVSRARTSKTLVGIEKKENLIKYNGIKNTVR